jgi:hypothetical protein
MTRRWLRHPLLHFLLIGMALFGLRALWPGTEAAGPPAQREPLVVTAARIETMRADFARRWGKPPSAEELSALIGQAIDEELLYREARALALDYEDPSVRRRLVEKMRVVGSRPGRAPDDLVREARELGLDDDTVVRRLLVEKMRLLLAQDPQAPPITQDELRDYLQSHRERFELPADISFSQVFLAEDKHGARLKRDAQALSLRARRLSPSAAAELSDPFLLGLRIHAWTLNRVMARFGKPFAEQVFALKPGAWSAPIASPYGVHLVWVEEKSAQRLPERDTVRQQLVEGVQKARAEAQLARGIARVRGLYDIRVEGREDLSSSRTLAAGS